MKKLILILLALSPVVLKAQNAMPAGTNKEVLYIVDSVKTTKEQLGGIDPKDISAVEILKDVSATAKYGAEGANGVAIITTKKFAVKQYQEKFSMFSDDFESYLTSHGKNDSQFIYVIDGVTVEKNNSESYKLNSIPKDKIESVTFVQDQPEGSKIAAKIMIVTKK